MAKVMAPSKLAGELLAMGDMHVMDGAPVVSITPTCDGVAFTTKHGGSHFTMQDVADAATDEDMMGDEDSTVIVMVDVEGVAHLWKVYNHGAHVSAYVWQKLSKARLV